MGLEKEPARAERLRDALDGSLLPGEIVELAVAGSVSPVVEPVKAAAKSLGLAVATAAATGGLAFASSMPSVRNVLAIVTNQRLVLLQRGLFGGPTKRVLATMARKNCRLEPVAGIRFAPGYLICDREGNRFATLTFPAWRRSAASGLADLLNASC